MNKKVLVLGGSGLVGSRFVELYKDQLEINNPTRDELDLLDFPKLNQYIESHSSDVLVNFAAYTAVDKAEEERDNKEGQVYKLNVQLVEELIKACQNTNSRLIQISTDYVFDGTKKDSAYNEEDIPNPVSWYGETKYLAEKAILDNGRDSLLIRIQAPFRSHLEKKGDLVRFFYTQLKEGKEVTVVNDALLTPMFIDDFANCLNMLITNESQGIYHLGSTDFLTLFEFVKLLAQTFGFNESLIKPTTFAEYSQSRVAKRPKNTWFNVSKFEKEFGSAHLHTNQENLLKFKKQIDLKDQS